MIQNLLAMLAQFIVKRPQIVVCIGVIGCLIFASLIRTVPVDLSFSSIINRQIPLVDRYFSMNEDLGFGSKVVYLLTGPEDKLDDAVSTLKDTLERRNDVRVVLTKPPKGWLTKQAPWFIADEQLNMWLQAASNLKNVHQFENLQEYFRKL